ncbi:D-methionine transport system ATP-binding protein [Herbaspirillum rubrisubalbicans]|uniref:Cell division ATP-binding protein FtsE n=1 Tax=Herbaspirillum rubrisubalbicans Os34 TaxID=1235827 RepID=A0A6M3ZRK9_9BURK|nr:ATP-binding cassette domain-containing protein [Herbaspirillum rubrisubalbicans]MCP1572698.1 D-methionine transport system ATP-binding protein [Herbaspirillum rubrisubalbicans]QJQ01285.1 methionine ABC transporter ATP-binding protein [Herbaspirillum rubrisubalbicans Os34]
MELTITARQSLTAPSRSELLREPAPTTTLVGSTPGTARKGTVALRDVGKTYTSSAGSVQALQGIDLEIAPGSIFGIIGRSGAGKSSLLRTINRLETPTSGRVEVDGVDLATLNEGQLVDLRRRIGMIFQHFNLLSAKTVFDNVALPLRVAGVPRLQVESRVRELLALVGLADKADTYPRRLSGGQKQRVGIARALASGPEILLCDEATSALDPETTHAILQLLREINRKLGITIILITHEMSVIREIADQVLVLEQGRIAELGQVWEVFGHPRHAATQALLAPLQQGLPPELQQALQAQPPATEHERVLQLQYRGGDGLEPDLLRIAQALGGKTRLLQANVERIQGHTQGQLYVALAGVSETPDWQALTQGPQAIAHHIKELGYVV